MSVGEAGDGSNLMKSFILIHSCILYGVNDCIFHEQSTVWSACVFESISLPSTGVP